MRKLFVFLSLMTVASTAAFSTNFKNESVVFQNDFMQDTSVFTIKQSGLLMLIKQSILSSNF